MTIDPDARFVDTVTPTAGRTVSEGGTVLTFTGQLRGPDLTGDCLPTLPLTEGTVTFAPATCADATNWVILPNADGVQWWVDGAPMTGGTWAMSPAGGEVVVQATPMHGYGFGLEAQTRWEYTYPASEDACELASLAQTGASNALVGLGLAGIIITLIGFGVVIGRRHQQA